MVKIDVVVCLVILTGIVQTQKSNKQCTDRNAILFDAKLAKLVTLGDSGRNYPENKAELKHYCE